MHIFDVLELFLSCQFNNVHMFILLTPNLVQINIAILWTYFCGSKQLFILTHYDGDVI